MNNNIKAGAAAALLALLLGGCQSTGSEYEANAYTVTQVNQKQEAKTVKIISVMPAKVAVDNTKAKKSASTLGTLLGAVAGAAVGYNVGSGQSAAGTVAGGVAGGALGNAAAGMVDDKIMVEGVTLAYSENNKVYTSTQVGRNCEFQPGIALMVSTSADETRIQPNATCPKTDA